MTDPVPQKQHLLNEKFFAELDAKLLAELRGDLTRGHRAEALSEATGITDPAMLQELVELDIDVETLAAFRMVPLVAVAWSNRVVQQEERETLLEIAERHGIRPNSPARRMLEAWVWHEPQPELYAAWKDYVRVICKNLTPGAIAALRAEVIGQAEKVASAAGGFLGFGAIDRDEWRTLRELEAAFPVPDDVG
jgi:hypothetical protein